MELKDFYCGDCNLGLLETWISVFTRYGNFTLKYINDVIDHIVEAGIYMQFRKRCVHSLKLSKSENNPKMLCSHTCRRFLCLAFGICIGSCVHS
jgi:hypothetical protein